MSNSKPCLVFMQLLWSLLLLADGANREKVFSEQVLRFLVWLCVVLVWLCAELPDELERFLLAGVVTEVSQGAC